MNMIKRYALSGFVSFTLLEIINLIYTYTTGRIDKTNFVVIAIILSLGVGVIGILIGYIFGKFFTKLPTSNVCINAIALFILTGIGPQLLFHGAKSIFTISQLFIVIVDICLACFFVWFSNKLGTTKKA